MALDQEARDAAYLLGRLFAAYVYAEKSYQERGAGLRQKYMGAASATPARVFPVLMRGYEHNLASLRKAGGQKAGAGVKADRAVAAIIDGLEGGDARRPAAGGAGPVLHRLLPPDVRPSTPRPRMQPTR